MNTNLLIGLMVGVVVIAGGYFVTTRHSAPADTSAALTEQTNASGQSGKYSGSFAALAARGGSWKCTVDAKANTGAGQAASSGAAYVSGDSLRADFTTNVQGYGSVDSHLIIEGGYSYSWSSVMPQGIKTKVAAEDKGSAMASGQGGDADQSYSYDCQPWTADTSLFVAPTNVTFRTL